MNEHPTLTDEQELRDVTLTLKPEVARKLEAWSQATGATPDETLREALRSYFAEQGEARRAAR